MRQPMEIHKGLPSIHANFWLARHCHAASEKWLFMVGPAASVAFSTSEILTIDEGGCGLGVYSKVVEAEVVVVVEDDA